VSAGWRGPADGWFGRFVAPYDLERIAADHGAQSAGALSEEAAQTAALPGDSAPAEPAHGAPAHDGPAHDAPAHAEPTHAETSHDAGHGHDAAHDAHVEHVHHQAHLIAMFLSIAVAGLGILLSWLTYKKGRISSAAALARFPRVHHVLQNMYFFDQFYAATVYRAVLAWSRASGWFDRVVIDGIVNGCGYLTRFASWVTGVFDLRGVDGIVNGIAWVMQGAGEGFRRVQTGRVQTYLVFVCFSVVLLIFVFRAL
jgi:NADH-quinone oxidoreductase subunit L